MLHSFLLLVMTAKYSILEVEVSRRRCLLNTLFKNDIFKVQKPSTFYDSFLISISNEYSFSFLLVSGEELALKKTGRSIMSPRKARGFID